MNGVLILPKLAPSGDAPAGKCCLGVDASGNPILIDEDGTVFYLARPAPSQSDLTIAAPTNVALFSVSGFLAIRRKIIAGAGSGAYGAQYSLPTASQIPEAIARVHVELPASANPTVHLYDGSSAGTELATIINAAPATAAFWYGEFYFGADAHWHLLFQQYTQS